MSQVVTDKQLISMVLVLLFVDIGILTTWTVYDPMTIETKQLHEEVCFIGPCLLRRYEWQWTCPLANSILLSRFGTLYFDIYVF